MATHEVELTEREAALIADLVHEGFYTDANDAIHDGLRRIEQDRRDYTAKIDTLRAAVTAGFDDVDAGNYIDVRTEEDNEAFWNGIRAEVSERRRKRAQKSA